MRSLVTLLFVGACAGAPSEPAGEFDADVSEAAVKAKKATYAEQGWSAEVRAQIYHASEGSQLMPLSWFVSLESPGARAAFVRELESFGFIASDAPRELNPNRLPVGFTEDIDLETGVLYGEPSWVGINCTACHTAEIEVGGKRLRIDGAPSLVDLPRFQERLLAAVDATLADETKLERFAERVGAPDAADIEARLSLFSRAFHQRLNRNGELVTNGKTIVSGPGRLDGLGGPTNETLCELADLGSARLRSVMEKPENCRGGHPASSYPHVWGITREEYVQWAGNVHNSLGRNLGQANGVFGQNWVDEDSFGRPVFRTSADVVALHQIERWYDSLEAPSWADLARRKVLPAINRESAARGAALYAHHCDSCHAVTPRLTPPSALGYSFWQVGVFGLDEVGTDPGVLAVNAQRTAVVPEPLLDAFKQTFGPEVVGPDGAAPAAMYRALLIRAMIRDYFVKEQVPPREQQVLTDCRDGRQQPKIGYKARSLDGIGFTAPYLHNGSVPTLDDLLRPASERPKTFYLGCRRYDTERLGYRCDASSERAFLFDTSLPSNSNQGHEYGTSLDRTQRADLIAYIKTLTSPEHPPLPAGGACNDR